MDDAGDAWKFELLDGERGPKPTVENAVVLLTKHPAWVGKIGFCERRKAPVLLGDVGKMWKAGLWQDSHSIEFMAWAERCLEGNGGGANRHGITFNRKIVDYSIDAVSMRNRFDPVGQYAIGLEWDGIERLNTFLIDYAEAPDEPWVHEVTRRWMISAVARTFNPGCQADHVLVLEGPQSAGKTSLFRVLGGEWMMEHHGELATRDTIVECNSNWIIELGELASIRRSKDIESVKAFITRREDQFVNKYDKYTTRWPRRFVLGASLNPDGIGWIADSTGGRRFWPIKVGSISVDAITQCRDQLWAEAVHWFRQGEPWWLANGEVANCLKEAQADRIDVDSWEDDIERYINEQPYPDQDGHRIWSKRAEPLSHVTVSEILERCLGLPVGKHDKVAQMRVAKILARKDFEKKRNTTFNGKKATWWVRNGAEILLPLPTTTHT